MIPFTVTVPQQCTNLYANIYVALGKQIDRHAHREEDIDVTRLQAKKRKHQEGKKEIIQIAVLQD